jgi:tetratricopeptide (TPR) repeat protein
MMWLFLLLFADQFETTFRAGLIALNENNLTVAESELEKASQIQPANPRVWLALTQTYWKLHKLSSSQTAARTAEKFADDAIVVHGLALFYSETGDYAKAAELADRAIAQNPFNEGYYFDLAQLHLKQENFAAALKTLDRGRKNFDKSAQLELAAGVAYYGLRRFPEAIDAFLRTIQLDPGVEQPYVFLGRVLDQAEDKLPRITAAFAAFAKSGPKSDLSSFLYGKALVLQDPGQAEAWLRKSIAQNSQFWESHFQLGVLLDQQGKFAEAASEVRRGIDLNPGDPVPHYRLARLYERLGKGAEARAELELHAKLSGGAIHTGPAMK